jgi:hypothetical protein
LGESRTTDVCASPDPLPPLISVSPPKVTGAPSLVPRVALGALPLLGVSTLGAPPLDETTSFGKGVTGADAGGFAAILDRLDVVSGATIRLNHSLSDINIASTVTNELNAQIDAITFFIFFLPSFFK